MPPVKTHTTEFTIDGEPFSTTEKKLTARQILTDYAHADPATTYLIWVHGREQTPYETNPDDPIEIHNKQVFITAATGPTPVS